MNLAFNASDPTIKSARWIASLSDGSTVFENHIPNSLSAWQRLKRYLLEKKLFITGMRLQLADKLVAIPSFKGSDGIRQVDGYWQSKRVTKIDLFQEYYEHGIGYIIGSSLHITWINESTGNISTEVRVFDKTKDLAHILHD